MSVNSSRGRLSAVTGQLKKKAEATAAGIDVTDRAAFRAFEEAQTEAFWTSRTIRILPDGNLPEQPSAVPPTKCLGSSGTGEAAR